MCLVKNIFRGTRRTFFHPIDDAISVVGALIVYSAEAPAVRGPVLVAAIVEKFAVGLLIFFGLRNGQAS